MNRLWFCKATAVLVWVAMLLYVTRQTGMTQGSWATLPPLPMPIDALGAATGPDGRIYVCGGQNGSPANYLDMVQAYDPTTNVWTPVASMPTARSAPSVVTGLDGRIYVIGGYNAAGLTEANEAYDTVSQKWSQLAPLPTLRQGQCAAVGPDGIIYVIGGFVDGEYMQTVEAYNPQTNSWAATTPFPTPISNAGAAVGGDGRIYVAGGYNGQNVTNAVYAFEVQLQTWVAVSPMPLATYYPAAAGLNGKIYIVGGINNGTFYNTAQVYDPATSLWTTIAPMPTPRFSGAGTAGLDGRMYVLGGQYGDYPSGVLNTVEAYTPDQPPFVKDVVATVTSASTATITWQTISDLDVQCELDYGLTTAYGSSIIEGSILNQLDIPGGYPHSASLSGLQPNTQYHFRITVPNAAHNPTSSDYTFTTGAGLGITHLATTPDSSGALITWTTNNPANSKVEFGTTISYGASVTNPNLVTGHSIDLTGSLLPNTLYHFRVTSTDAGNNTAVSADQTFVTAPVTVVNSGGWALSIVRRADGSYLLTARLTYQLLPGAIQVPMDNLTLVYAKLGAAQTITTLPLGLRTLSPGLATQFSLVFPASAGQPGSAVALSLDCTYQSAPLFFTLPFDSSFRSVVLP